MAKTKPQTEQKTTIKDWDEADTILNEIGKLNQNIKSEQADKNLAISKVQEKYQPGIDEMEAEKIGMARNLQLFCEERRAEFDEKKSKELSYGMVAFRLGTGALKTLKGWTWAAVEAFVGRSKKYNQYLVIKTSLNKNGLKTDLPQNELAKIGCTIEQEEAFYYECYERK